MIKLYYFSARTNFGDMISPIVVKWISGQDVELVSNKVDHKVIALGSIMTHVKEGDIVWGTGTIEDKEFIAPPRAKFLAVRGPLSRALIKNAKVPEVYGDPALLMPKIYIPKEIKHYKICLIPHEVDKLQFDIRDMNIRVVDINNNVYDIIDQITSSDVVISTSLHGIIVAEAYGIPAIWIKVSDKIIGGNHKFNDYFLSTSRNIQEPIVFNGSITEKEILKICNEVLPTPIINTEPLIKAWRDYYGNSK